MNKNQVLIWGSVVIALVVSVALGMYKGFLVPKSEKTLIVDSTQTSIETPQVDAKPAQIQKKFIPFAPFHFGERVTDYSYLKDGVVAGDVFTGGFIHLGIASTTAKVEQAVELLDLARSKGSKVIVSVSDSYPCTYWNNSVLNSAQLNSDVEKLIPTISKYYPETLLGIMLINEPHDPQEACAKPIPPMDLYAAAKLIRKNLDAAGLKGIPLGFGSHATYFDGKIPVDGTITLANSQYSPQRGSIQDFMKTQQDAARRMGIKLYLTVNASKAGEQLTDNLVTICQNADTNVVIATGYWTWNRNGGNQSVPLSELLNIQDSCQR